MLRDGLQSGVSRVCLRIDPVVQRADLGVFARRILFMRTGDDGPGFTSAVDAIDQGRFLIGVVAAAKLLHASHEKKVVSKTMEAFLGAGPPPANALGDT